MLMTRYVTLSTESVSASCAVRELSSPRVDQSMRWHIHELSSNHLANCTVLMCMCYKFTVISSYIGDQHIAAAALQICCALS